MSVSGIMDYVRKTPGNTNPAVVKTMTESVVEEFLDEAKAYTDSQRLGYAEAGPILTFDGNLQGKETVENFFVKISDQVFDLEKVKEIWLFDNESQENIEIPKGDWYIIKKVINIDGKLGEMPVIIEENTPIVLSIQEPCWLIEGEVFFPSPGIYTIYMPEEEQKLIRWISKIVFNETIHKIDPKFYTETLDVTDYHFSLLSSEEVEAEITAEQADRFKAAFATHNLIFTEFTSIGDDDVTIHSPALMYIEAPQNIIVSCLMVSQTLKYITLSGQKITVSSTL